MRPMPAPPAPAVDQDVPGVQGGTADLTHIECRLAPYFERAEPRRRAITYLRGVRSPAERKNSWQLAEARGEATPDGLQHLLGRALWDPEAMRDALRTDVIEHLGDTKAVLGIEETGLLTKGRHSADVARQYSGTAGRMEHGQIGVLLAYASRHGHAWLDRDLSVPQVWTDAPGRCQQAGIPKDRRVATKPALAGQRLARSLAAGVPAAWGAGDRVYGNDRRVRMALEARPQGDVLAVSGKEDVWRDWHQRQVKTVLAALPEDGWSRLRAGDGAQGPRGDDWRWLSLAAPVEPGWGRWRLVRRRISEPSEVRASVVYTPQATTLAAVVRVAGRRWTIEICFEAATGEGGLDHDAVRRWTGWYRHSTRAL